MGGSTECCHSPGGTSRWTLSLGRPRAAPDETECHLDADGHKDPEFNDWRTRVIAAERNPDHVVIMPAVMPIIGHNHEEAEGCGKN